jgi:hypothetical protein
MEQVQVKVKKFLKSNEVAIRLGINFFGESIKILIEYFK